MYDELIKRLREHNGWALNETLDQAADAIEELSRENESLAKSVNEAGEILRKHWIPVTERLPEDRKMVLAAVDGVVRIAFYGNYMWEEVGTYSIFYPTHWMPLP